MAVPVTFSQQVLGSLCCLLSFPLTAPSHTQRAVIRHSVSVPSTTPRGIFHNQEHTSNIKLLYFLSLTVPHCVSLKRYSKYFAIPLESQISVKWKKNTWLASMEMKRGVKHPAHKSHPLSSWPPCPSSESLTPDISVTPAAGRKGTIPPTQTNNESSFCAETAGSVPYCLLITSPGKNQNFC